jgi:hypothetical protein
VAKSRWLRIQSVNRVFALTLLFKSSGVMHPLLTQPPPIVWPRVSVSLPYGNYVSCSMTRPVERRAYNGLPRTQSESASEELLRRNRCDACLLVVAGLSRYALAHTRNLVCICNCWAVPRNCTRCRLTKSSSFSIATACSKNSSIRICENRQVSKRYRLTHSKQF